MRRCAAGPRQDRVKTAPHCTQRAGPVCDDSMRRRNSRHSDSCAGPVCIGWTHENGVFPRLYPSLYISLSLSLSGAVSRPPTHLSFAPSFCLLRRVRKTNLPLVLSLPACARKCSPPTPLSLPTAPAADPPHRPGRCSTGSGWPAPASTPSPRRRRQTCAAPGEFSTSGWAGGPPSSPPRLAAPGGRAAAPSAGGAGPLRPC
jgi:hypothetical protein